MAQRPKEKKKKINEIKLSTSNLNLSCRIVIEYGFFFSSRELKESIESKMVITRQLGCWKLPV